MKTILITLLLLLGVIVAKAQITFEKTYKSLAQEEAAQSVIEDGNGGYVISTGPKRNPPSIIREFGLVHLNAYGDTLWCTIYNRGYRSEGSVLRKSASAYYVAGVAEDSAGNNGLMLWLCKFDLNGNLLWNRNILDFNFPIATWGLTFTVLSDGFLFANGSSGGFLKLDTNATILNIQSYYHYLGGTRPFRKSDMQKRGNLFIYNSTYVPVFVPGGSQTPKILLVDANGDSVRSFPINLDSSWGAPYTNIYESNFIVFASNAGVYIPNANDFVLSKLDSLGNRIWRKPVPGINTSNTNVNSHALLPTGNFVIAGFPSYQSISGAPQKRAFLYCFDVNGDSLWYKQYSPSDSTLKTDFYDVIATSDSCLLACGQVLRPNGSRESYIVKVDANGNLFNPLAVLEKRKESYLHLYPNPAKERVSLHYMGFSKDASLYIRNAIGQSVYTQKLNSNDENIQLNTEQFPPGIYTCSIQSNERLLALKKMVIVR